MSRRQRSPEPGSPAWIALRRSGIGATDAAVVTGHSRWGGPFDKYQEMQGRTAPKIATDAMTWGILLEPVVARAWAEKHGRKVRSNRWTYFYPGRDDIFSHYDADVLPTTGSRVVEILEVKTASAYAQRDFGEEGTDQVPKEYLLQVHHELACRPGIVRAHLAVLVGGQRLKSYTIEHDAEMIDALIAVETAFLDNTKAGIAPAVDGSDSCTDYLRDRFPKDDGSLVALSDAVEADALAYLAVLAEEKDVVERKALVGNRLRAALESASGGTGKDVRVSYKATKERVEVNWREAATLHLTPEQLAHYTTTKPGNRPLVVSWVSDT